MINSHHLVNPLIEGMTSDTLGRCEESLAYIAETITSLQSQEATAVAYQGLQSLMECVQYALAYEAERLSNEEVSQKGESAGDDIKSSKH
jgi:hypothetical protein